MSRARELAPGASLPPGWRPGMPLPTAVTRPVAEISPTDIVWVAWDEVCQTECAEGLEEVAAYMVEHPASGVCFRIRGERGLRRPSFAEAHIVRSAMARLK